MPLLLNMSACVSCHPHFFTFRLHSFGQFPFPFCHVMLWIFSYLMENEWGFFPHILLVPTIIYLFQERKVNQNAYWTMNKDILHFKLPKGYWMLAYNWGVRGKSRPYFISFCIGNLSLWRVAKEDPKPSYISKCMK